MAHRPDGQSLFAAYAVSDPPRRVRLGVVSCSFLAHAVVVAILFLVPIFRPSMPEIVDPLRAFLYNPPPPPPPPLQKSSEVVKKTESPRAVVSAVKPDETRLTAPDEQPKAQSTEERVTETAGDPAGSDYGNKEGMEGGTDGGQVGGVPGGVLGGVIGGTGDIVLDYDQPPRIIHQVKPRYPLDAFTKKIEGTVEVEFIIGPDGRVRRVWIVHSIPVLNDAAMEAVSQWVFTPAIKRGVPVATTARAPVVFRIF